MMRMMRTFRCVSTKHMRFEGEDGVEEQTIGAEFREVAPVDSGGLEENGGGSITLHSPPDGAFEVGRVYVVEFRIPDGCGSPNARDEEKKSTALGKPTIGK